ncbi:unnamed protein product [Oncorhynchus mykiss]|uniref:Cytochrome b-c1 complex subunit 7 n=1 Tax=Oncorhynchus mykiss TaxID=8022 RepID=A0A060XKF8_ONCMY|nr:unnamed protein product [Oncorhynchus mykiss]
MASRAPATTGRLLVSFRKWYYNAAGFNKIGLMRDDTIHEDSDVKEALRRLPEKVYNDRMFRLKRALDLSMKQAVLPKEQRTQYEETWAQMTYSGLIQTWAQIISSTLCLINLSWFNGLIKWS